MLLPGAADGGQAGNRKAGWTAVSIFFIGRGNCYLGRTARDKDGNVLEEVPAHFDFDSDGGSVAMGVLDPETMQPSGAVVLYGDYDAAGYLAKVLELLRPSRQVNIPDLEAIVKAAYAEGNDLICDYCQKLNCQDCIVREWKDDE